ncbi:CHAT domain-containing protein [Streptomyces hayashii]|uniref:CHAT domain-containing protein n=1 Tax=Streptomyces hayashii TaxID=2839966 RepID=UPI00403C1279
MNAEVAPMGGAQTHFSRGLFLEMAGEKSEAISEFSLARDLAVSAANYRLAAASLLRRATCELDEKYLDRALCHISEASNTIGHDGEPGNRESQALDVLIESLWLDLLIETEAVDGTETEKSETLRHCLRIHELTGGGVDSGPISEIREKACFYAAKLIAERGMPEDALPFAAESAESSFQRSEPEARIAEFLMRLVCAQGYRLTGKAQESEWSNLRALFLALSIKDTKLADAAFQNLNELFMPDRVHGSHRFSLLAEIFHFTDDVWAEAVCRFSSAFHASGKLSSNNIEAWRSLHREFLHSAVILEEQHDFRRAADAYYNAGFALHNIHLKEPSVEYVDQAITSLDKASDYADKVENWLLAGISEGLLAHFCKDSPYLARLHYEKCVEKCEKGCPSLHFDVATQLAVHLTQNDSNGEWLGASSEAVRIYAQAWEQDVSPLNYTLYHYTRKSIRQQGLRILASQACKQRWHESDSRWNELVWGLEHAMKAPLLQEEKLQELWHRLLRDDEILRTHARNEESAQINLEFEIKEGHTSEAESIREQLHAHRQAREERITQLTRTSRGDPIRLASAPPVGISNLQGKLTPGQVYVGLVEGRGGNILRSRVMKEIYSLDVAMAPDLVQAILKAERDGTNIDSLPAAIRDAVYSAASKLIGPMPAEVDTILVCPDWHLVAIPWHSIHSDRVTSVVPAVGIYAGWQPNYDTSNQRPYLGVAYNYEGNFIVDHSVRQICGKYFPESGSVLTSDYSNSLFAQRGHVEILHIACHATAGGIWLGGRWVTPIDLLDVPLTARILLLTCCDTGEFATDTRNEFLGIVRGLLTVTHAEAAVVTYTTIDEPAACVFADLLIAALKNVGQTSANIGDAVEQARRKTAELPDRDVKILLPESHSMMALARTPSWWDPWYVFGDPKSAPNWS